MPGNLIKQYTSQADWQSGTAEGLDLTSQPGDVLLTDDYIKQYLADADWNAGVHNNTEATTGKVQLKNAGIYLSGARAGGFSVEYLRQYISARGLVEWIAWNVKGLLTDGTYTVKLCLRRAANYSDIIWTYTGVLTTAYKFIGADPRLAGNPIGDLVLTEDVYLEVSVFHPSYAEMAYTTSAHPVHAGRNLEASSTGTSWETKSGKYGTIQLRVKGDYLSPGTWTSPWLAHNITTPASTWLSYALAALPTGSSVVAHIRWSPDNGGTPTEWAEATNGAPLPGTPQAYVQVRLTLTATDDLTETPIVSLLTLIIGELHRWTSPAIDITDTADPKAISTLVTGLQVSQEVKLGAGAWQASSGIIETGSATTMQIRLTLARTGSGDQYLSELSIFETLILQMLDEPTPSIRPPEVTDVICYVEDSEPLIEVTASLPDVPEDKRIEVRISVPAGSSQSYAQAYADAWLAVHGVEKRSLTCRVPICTRIGFAELVAVVYPPWGHGNANPWLAMVQEITHRPLASPPATELILGDYQPDDTEALVQLIAN